MQRGEVWLINLSPNVGAEIHKTRPALIVNDDDVGILPLKIIVPITDWKDRLFATRSEPRSTHSIADSFPAFVKNKD